MEPCWLHLKESETDKIVCICTEGNENQAKKQVFDHFLIHAQWLFLQG